MVIRRIFGFLFFLILYVLGFPVLFFRAIDNFVFSGFGYDSVEDVRRKVKGLKGKDIAVLVSGLGRVEAYVSRMNRIHRAAYLGLRNRGYKDEQIIVLSNNVCRSRGFGVNAKPNIKNLESVLRVVLEKNPKSVVFHFIGHGHRKRGSSTMLVGLRNYFPEQLYDFFVDYNGNKIFIFDQCFSGGFLKKFKGLKNSVVLASTKEDYSSSNKTEVEIDFWKRIGLGGGVVGAYKAAAKISRKKSFYGWVVKEFSKITQSKIGDFYLVSKSSNIDIPRLNNKKLGGI